MANNNVALVFDESETNIISDASYETDTQRLNGFVSGIARSNMFNKVLNQTSSVANAEGTLYLNDTSGNGLFGEQFDTDLSTSLLGAFKKHRKSSSFVVPIYKSANTSGDTKTTSNPNTYTVDFVNKPMLNAYSACAITLYSRFCEKSISTGTFNPNVNPSIRLRPRFTSYLTNPATVVEDTNDNKLFLYNNYYNNASEYAIRLTSRRGVYLKNSAFNSLKYFMERQEYLELNIRGFSDYNGPMTNAQPVGYTGPKLIEYLGQNVRFDGLKIYLQNLSSHEYILGDTFAIIELFE